MIDQEARFFWNAYQELSADRPPAFSGMAPIPLASILTYASFLGMTEREADDFLRIIRTVDNRNLVLIANRQAENKNSHDR